MVVNFLLSAVCLLGLALSGRALGDGDGLFVVFSGEWETCKRINSSSTCYRTRDVHCRTVLDAKPTPWRFCTDVGMPRDAGVEECKCEQDCVVTKWGEWTPCNESVAYTTRHRSVVAPRLEDGKPCPALQETKRCETSPATIAQLKRSHTWRLGPWLECVAIRPDKQCGEGLRRRSVDCIDLRGRFVNQTLCLQEEAYLEVLPPQLVELCEVPCPCELSVWGAWSNGVPTNCSLANPSLVRHRTRTIHQHPTLGERCEALEQFETLPGESECPDYRWETSGWSECTVIDGGATCGVGLRERYTYCIRENTNGHVSSDECNSSLRPSSLGSCEVPCPQDCVVSEWSEWSNCRNDTCETQYIHHNRTLLLGQDSSCPHLVESQECPPIPCVSWVPEEWPTVCFPTGGEECGWGTYSRGISCENPAGERIDNVLCVGAPLPTGVTFCYKACVNDSCVISEWSEWSECSETCGGAIGVQTRSRYLVVNSSDPCVHHNTQLSEEQNCNVFLPCQVPVYHSEPGEWSDCHVPSDAMRDEETCEGTRNRTVYCFKDGVQIPHSECPVSGFSSFEEQTCSVLCSSECVMSEWSPLSECSESCLQTRTRRLLSFGEICPHHLDHNGVETESEPCDCSDQEYHWVTKDSWSKCHIFPTPLSVLPPGTLVPDQGMQCGQGYRNRSVVCQDENGEEVREGFCRAETRPASFEMCLVPCTHRCIITDWTEFSICSDGMDMERTRDIIKPESSLSDCPSLESVALADSETCPVNDFSSKFQRVNTFGFGELNDCYLEPEAVCGRGEAYRTYGCVDRYLPMEERVAVNPEFCPSVGRSESVQTCSVPCNIDCEYGNGWSLWSPCSVTCGAGFQTRTRSSSRTPVHEEGGRPCQHLSQNRTCEMEPCGYPEYVNRPIPPPVCEPLNGTLGCGPGERLMEAVCLINGVSQPNTSACEPKLGPRSPSPDPCHAPCEGECVLSEWSEWNWCPDCNSGCYRKTRRILRRGTDNCEGVELSRVRSCSSSKFVWSAGEWSDCVVEWTPRSQRDYCGHGVQRRSVECVLIRNGEVAYDAKCVGQERPLSARGCSIPCPIDCVVGSFSEWSYCGECTSDLRATRTRERRVLVQQENGGRDCPHLTERQSCPNIGCDEYFVETNTTALNCSAETTTQTCGRIPHTVLLCRKNTVYVPLEECMEANATGKIIHRADLLNRHDLYCDIECPEIPECLFGHYGEWSECLHMCDWPAPPSQELFQFRSHRLLSHWEGSGDKCHGEQVEVRACTLTSTNATTIDLREGSKCIRFDWRTSEWYVNNTRDVQCQSNGSRVDESACVASEEPVAVKNVEDKGVCDCSVFSNCDGRTTECVCAAGFERIASFCLPIEGCVESPELNGSQQCLPREVCSDAGRCMCMEGDCVQPTPSLTDPPATPRPTDDTTSAQPTDYLLIVIISVPLLLLIVVLLIIIIVTCKCRQHLEKKHRRQRPAPVILHQNQQLNNQSDAAKNRDLKEGGVRVQEVATETTSHPMHHMHNGSASSGFVDEMEHDMLKYGQASFQGYSQTQSDIDEAVFSGNPYGPYHDPPSLPYTPTAPHPPYAPYEIEEEDSGPYRPHHGGNGMRTANDPQSHIPPHLSLSEEAQLALMSGRMARSYDAREDVDNQFSQDLPEHLEHHDANYYPPSPKFTRAHPHSSHHHHQNHHHHHHQGYSGSGRDNRLMVGLDTTLVRAIEQVTASEAGSRSPSVSSVGSRSSARRSGRRRHHHRGYRDVRIHSPVGGPTHSAQGYYGYYREGEQYQSNTLPRSGSKRSSSAAMAPRSPRIQARNDASPLVNNLTTPTNHHIRSASTELVETRSHHHHHRHHAVPVDVSRDAAHDQHPTEMPQALPDNEHYPAVFRASNPLTTSPPSSSSTGSAEADYDHIAPSPVGGVPAPPPPPLPPANLKPPSSKLIPPQQMTPSSSSPHSPRSPNSTSSGEFGQELFSAIQKRAVANSSNTPAAPVSMMMTSPDSSPSSAPPPPPPRTVSDPLRGGRGRFTAVMLSAYNTPPASNGLQNGSLVSNQVGGAPPPPPVRSS